jgi:hypothetical protein
MSTLHIAQLFHVNARRVAEILRTEGTLRPPASTSRRDNPTHLKLKLDPQTADVVRTRARDTQRTLVAYVRDLIDADLQAWPS